MDAKKKKIILSIIIIAILAVALYFTLKNSELQPQTEHGSVPAPSADIQVITEVTDSFNYADVPEYSGGAYAILNSNTPYFKDNEKKTEVFENYSPLDTLGRCGPAYANICKELMPTQKRGEIYTVKPSGWQHVEYDFVDGFSLYNRCHLIAHSLAGEDANEKNLITGTRYMNTEGMNPFENMVVDYVKETGNHVLYRVTPVFEGSNLLASGVLMEGWSVEDEGEGVCYCVFCYNVQPGIEIDFSNGKSRLAEKEGSYKYSSDDVVDTYILNTKTLKFHMPYCENVSEIAKAYKKEYTGRRGDLIEQGYVPCKGCNP
ncbi:MAG: DNA/RNA non-specific endonuclease [Clostridia bacterium]|nr:DNA/RNA non-specific endonuclease [Clostridia bacterium]